MAEKLLTLIQDTTGDEIYPNIKEDNLPPSVRGELQKIDTKQDKLTNTQMYAVNSGITQNKVATYDGYNTTITTLNNDLTDAINEINNKQDKIFTSTANPFVLTEDGTGIDLHKLQFTNNGILKIGDVVTQIPSDTYIQGELDKKQDTLVSGTNIKTLNGQSILGSGDLPISGSGGSSDTAIITLTAEQVQSLANFNITFTQEQATLLEKATSFKFYYAGNEIAHGQCGKIALGVNILYGLLINAGGNIYLGQSESGLLTNYTQKIFIKSVNSIKIVTDKDIFVSDSTIQIGFEEFLGDGTILNSKYIYFDTINGTSIVHDENTPTKNYDLGKSINLFGKHSILVPNASTDTNIDLYNHDIEINFEYDQNQASYHVYLNVVSSKNLNVGNITDLKTLLGNTFRRSCTSGNDNSAQQEVIAISNDGFDFNNFSSILFSEVTNIIITDTVTTI